MGWADDLLNDAQTVPTVAPKAPSTKSFSDELLGGPLGGGYGAVAPYSEAVHDEGGAGLLDIATASLAEDPEAMKHYFAKEMNIPVERFGVIEGDLVYRDDQGKLQRVVPSGDYLKRMATGVGPMLPAIGGIAGVAATVPTGPGMAAGGVGGAMGGAALREALARKFVGQDYSLTRVGLEGLYDIGGTAAASLIAKGLGRAAASRAGKQINRLVKTKGMAAADALQETVNSINKKYKTKFVLTPAELTQNARLRGQQMGLGNRPQTAGQLEDFYTARGDEADTIMRQHLDEISPQANVDEAGRQLSEVAEQAQKTARQTRSTVGSPAYEQAFDLAEKRGGVDVTPVLDEIEKHWKTGSKMLRRELDDVRNELIQEVGGKPHLETDLRMIQNRVKELIDDKISSAGRAGNNKVASRLISIQDTLLDSLDKQIPEYAKARGIWSALSTDVDAVKGSIIPKLAKTTSKDFEYMGRKFMSSASPAEIGRVRARVVLEPGGQEAWDATLRGFLEQTWEKAGREFKSTVGRPAVGKMARPVTFATELTGDLAQSGRIRAAMTEKQWKAFKEITDAFRATGTALNWNSTTVAQALGEADLKGGLAEKGVRGIGNVFSMQPLKATTDAIADKIWTSGQNDLLNIIIHEGAVDELLDIARKTGKKDRAAAVLSRVISFAQVTARHALGEMEGAPPQEAN